MAQGDSSDIFVIFCIYKGVPILGGSTTVLNTVTEPLDDISKRMFSNFAPGKMFEIDNFSFAVGLHDETPDKPEASKPSQASNRQTPAKPGVAGHRIGPQAAADKPHQSFKAWRSGGSDMKYPVSVQPITLTRPIDRASGTLLQYCIDSTSFESVSLVKRKSSGGAAAGKPYLRMDFTGVLITEISWTNDEPVKETCKIISRAITVNYRPQLPDGSLGHLRHGHWSMLPNTNEVVL